MKEETNLQQIYRESTIQHIRELSHLLSVAEQDNLNDIVEHMASIKHVADSLNRSLSVLSVLRCHQL